MNLKRNRRALPFALAAASLSFGSGCDVDASTEDDDGSDVDSDGGTSDGGGADGGAADGGGDRNVRNTGGSGTRTTGSSGDTTGSSGDTTGSGGTTGSGSGGLSTVLEDFASALCGRYEACDPDALATELGGREQCEEYIDTYYTDYYVYYVDTAADPDACGEAVESYFDCLAELYTSATCEQFLTQSLAAECDAEGAAADLACVL